MVQGTAPGRWCHFPCHHLQGPFPSQGLQNVTKNTYGGAGCGAYSPDAQPQDGQDWKADQKQGANYLIAFDAINKRVLKLGKDAEWNDEDEVVGNLSFHFHLC